MHFSRISIFLSLLVLVVASGCSSETGEPTDLSDPGFLPTGTYELAVTAASCNVNASFQSTGRVALVRNGAGKPAVVNIPVPAQIRDANEGDAFGTPRQDVDLTTRHVEFDRQDDARCGTVTTTIDATELSAKRLAIAYSETPAAGCAVPACSVEYAFELVEAACSPDCKSKGATLHVGPGGSMIWQCECE